MDSTPEFFVSLVCEGTADITPWDHVGVLKRAQYVLTRAVITRSDGGGNTFNVAEVVSSGAAAGNLICLLPRAVSYMDPDRTLMGDQYRPG